MRPIILSIFLALTLPISGGCRRPPDIRRLCEKKCMCGCNIDECVQSETARRNQYRKNDYCSKKIDEMTECEIEHGTCEKMPRGISFGSAACGELLGEVVGCGLLRESPARQHSEEAP